MGVSKHFRTNTIHMQNTRIPSIYMYTAPVDLGYRSMQYTYIGLGG